MGNQKSIQSQNFSDESLKDFNNNTEYIRDSDDPCFGEIQIHKRLYSLNPHPDEQLIFVKYKSEPNKQDYTDLYRECDLRLSYSHPALLDFLGYDFRCQKNICGTANKCALYYQYYERDLEHEITKRAVSQNFFSEKEVLYLLEQLASVGSYLQSQNIYHGDLRPVNIFISPFGKVKVGDHLLLNQYRNNYLKALILGNQEVFLSPELMRALTDVEKEPTYSEFKADVWSLGMTILEVCSLCPSIQCYDFNEYASMTISYGKIQDLLTRISQVYSFELISIIKSMLEEDERIRPDMQQLYQMCTSPFSCKQSLTSSRYTSQYISPEKQRDLVEVSRIQNLYQTNHIRQPNMQVTRVFPKAIQIQPQHIQHPQIIPQSRVIPNDQMIFPNQSIVRQLSPSRIVSPNQNYGSLQSTVPLYNRPQQNRNIVINVNEQGQGQGQGQNEQDKKYDALQSRIKQALEQTRRTLQENQQE